MMAQTLPTRMQARKETLYLLYVNIIFNEHQFEHM